MNRLFLFFVIGVVLICSEVLSAYPFRSKYFIAVKNQGENILDSLEDHHAFLPPRNRFYADPILFKYQGINYLFFEDYDYVKGIISYTTIDENLQFTKVEKALELPCHLSFPYVFEDNGTIYMIPETFQMKEVSLFKAIEFPGKWEKVKTLVQGEPFVDSIVFQHGGYYWLFTSSASTGSRMFIYYATSLEGDFSPHPMNKKEIPGRNAGPLFYYEGSLVRPVMDNQEVYGKAMILKEIVHLDPTRFEERDIRRIDPTWAPKLTGTHTLNMHNDLVVYDGRRDIHVSEDPFYSAP